MIHRFTEIMNPELVNPSATIGSFTFIGRDVVIRDRVKIEGHCYIPEGVIIHENVFIAPAVTFLNDKHPPSNGKHWGKVVVKSGASIGGGSTILPNVTIGKNAVIGAGSVVTKDVPDGETWFGNPARKYIKEEEYCL